jgi:hypothetical protein
MLTSKKGFTFTITSLIIVITLISSILIIRTLPIIISIRENDSFAIKNQITKSLLFTASSSKSPDDYVNYILSLPNINNFINIISGTGKGFSIPYNFPSNSIIKLENKTDGDYIIINNLPRDYLAVITDNKFRIIGYSNGNYVNISDVKNGWLIIYEKIYEYNLTISPYYNYTINQDFTININSWSPPSGFSQIFIYGLPQLSLVQLFQDNELKSIKVKDLSSSFLVLNPSGMPFTGRLVLWYPVAWINSDISRGDVYLYIP